MKNIKLKILLAFLVASAFYACKKSFLEIKPNGVLDETTLSTEKGVGKILLSAYAVLDAADQGLGLSGQWGSSGSNFVFGSMAGGEANRGSTPLDQGPNMTNCIRHEFAPTNLALNERWKVTYEGVKRTNTVIQVLANVTSISDANRKNIMGQARALRAWYHFQAKILWGKVPYLDEKIAADLASGTIKSVPNDVDIYPKILEDAKYAYENLPAVQDAKGRINKWVAGAIYGKILMFAKDYATAKTVLNDVVTNGTVPTNSSIHFDLNDNFDDNFNVAFDNSKESVFAFQSSSQDGAGGYNANWGDNLNMPAQIGGAGFFCPTYFFTNYFKTDANGLPVASPQNKQVLDTAGVPVVGGPSAASLGYTPYTANVDTRLDWTIGRNGVPFHDWGTYATGWQRDKTAGPFADKKIMIRQSQVATAHDASLWFSSGGTSLNMNLIRFSDVILLLAEAEIEAPGGSLANAFALINRVRKRAQTTAVVSFPATLGVPVTKPYTVAFANQTEARNAVRLERLLELGMEGHRFFDLVRWGTATSELTAFYNYENAIPYQTNGDLTPKPTYTGGSKQDVYAIPQQQIDLSNGIIKQN